ncbi:hypothetical protein CEXT_585171 [Caerostris extrusa]|uniref:Uncharacterized protein n=1 Tax=Caerostris extrusa TaxID=172846 RepID=A0AAV4QME2_CAEEX|nr:hypothetical protein CEXT_585171 [Caerostris extrusa]
MTLIGNIRIPVHRKKATRPDVWPAIRHAKETESTRSHSPMPYISLIKTGEGVSSGKALVLKINGKTDWTRFDKGVENPYRGWRTPRSHSDFGEKKSLTYFSGSVKLWC